jgi:hypothetical protein
MINILITAIVTGLIATVTHLVFPELFSVMILLIIWGSFNAGYVAGVLENNEDKVL